MSQKTALFDEHVSLGGRVVDFAGWMLPVTYSGLMDEHLTCRTKAGLFDVSHMGEFFVEGPDAAQFLDELVTNWVSKLAVGQAQYNVLCRDDGTMVDDLVIYRLAQDRFLAVVNASNTDKDFSWFKEVLVRKPYRCALHNRSAEYSQIALQGPLAEKILQPLTETPLSPIKTYWFSEGSLLGDIPAIIARTGYTGEDGFELYVPWAKGPQVWRALMESGAPFGLKPCGLGARDTLRTEMKYPLYGHELSDDTHPLEAGLGWVVKLEKPSFVGKKALIAAKEKGFEKKLVGFKMKGKGIPRPGYAILGPDHAIVGIVTSGTHSPSLNEPIGIGYVQAAHSKIGGALSIDIRGSGVPAEIVQTPFLKK